MKKLIFIIIISCFLISCGGGSEEGNKIHVYAALGQSNMVGQGGEYFPSRPIDDRIMYLDLTNQLQIVEDSLYSEESDYLYIQNLDRYSCAISFAERMIQEMNTEDEIVIIPCAFGNTKIQWQLDCWEIYAERIQYVLDNYPNAVFEGIIYWQGENNIDDPDIWKKGILDLLNKIENEFGNVEFVFAQIGNNLTENDHYINMWENFKIEQQNFSIENDIKMIYTEDLPLFDHLHVNTTGLQIAGVRFAEEFLK